jgi:hypothetical protein
VCLLTLLETDIALQAHFGGIEGVDPLYISSAVLQRFRWDGMGWYGVRAGILGWPFITLSVRLLAHALYYMLYADAIGGCGVMSWLW